VTKEQKLVRAKAGLQRLAKQIGNVSQARKNVGLYLLNGMDSISMRTKRVCRRLGRASIRYSDTGVIGFLLFRSEAARRREANSSFATRHSSVVRTLSERLHQNFTHLSAT
jgi:hypothetical protein